MSDLASVAVFLIVAGLVIAVGVWLFLRLELNAGRPDSGEYGNENGQINECRPMEIGDWSNAAINLLIGILLGSVVEGLVQLLTTGLWLSAVVITSLGAGFFVFMLVFDKLFDRLLMIGVRPAPKPQVKRSTPLLRVMGFPSGFILGVVLAKLGLDDIVLGLIS